MSRMMNRLKSASLFTLLFASIVSVSIGARAADIDEAATPVEAVRTDSGIVLKAGKASFRLEDPAQGSEDRKIFDSLSESDKRDFLRNRTIFLSQAAKALSLMKYGFGIGVVVKDHVVYKMDQMRDAQATKALSSLPDGARLDALHASERDREERIAKQEQALKTTMRERSEDVVGGMLKNLDRTFWKQAALFSHANEVGVMFAGGVQLMGAVTGKFAIGGLIDFGVSIGYNRDTRSVAIQVFGDFERLTKTAVVAMVGAVGKAGLYISNQRPGGLEHHGTAFYPPSMPGFSMMTQDSFTTGFSSGGPLSFPPSPIGDMYTYTDTLDQHVFLRMTISPMVVGFVRVEFNHQIIVDSISKTVNQIQRLTGLRTCSAAFR